MDLNIVSIGSSSSGNSYVIRGGRTSLILDVGLAAKRIVAGLEGLGLSCEDVGGILVTHEHGDHIKSIRAMSRNCKNASVISSRGTAEHGKNFECVPQDRLRLVCAQDEFTLGDIQVKAFALSHDAAEPISYSFSYGGRQLTVVTDTGVVTDEIFHEIDSADMLVLEANHEVEMLRCGPYPYQLKQRILSDYGHLSNAAAGEALSQMLEKRLSGLTRTELASGEANAPHVMLAHLSTTNNTPDNAGMTVTDVVREHDFTLGTDYLMGIAAKDAVTRIWGDEEAAE